MYPKFEFYRKIVKSKLFIDQYYAEPIDLDTIAEQSFLSKFHFIRLFKKTYTLTPHQYLIKVRIDQAKLLLQSSVPISEVCFLVGFESISSFTGLFKKIVGCTPSAYQNQLHELKSSITLSPLKFIPHCFAEAKGWVEK